ncbi:hypothetical protein EOD39_21655 [Acipenser ruthenus]|uniref:Uncharacterized protein n=1 Tax=Acipenser ruthenus TaxID=7906 RepID=A0A444US42_ACIRT|nr:hypothetical protein EOD39_21655 [Acipenser ruthenus]
MRSYGAALHVRFEKCIMVTAGSEADRRGIVSGGGWMVHGVTERSVSSFPDEEGDIGMSSSSSSEHLADDREAHLHPWDPTR